MSRYRKDAILEFLGREKKNVLDIGCGGGQLGEIIKKENSSTVFGIDVSEAACQEAAAKLDRVFCFDVQMPFEKWSDEIKEIRFDGVIISEVLEHLFYPENLLGKIKNLLAPSAKIIVTVPNVLFWKNRLKIFFGKFDYASEGLMDRGHIHFFSWASLREMVKESGYSFVGACHHFPTRGTKWLGKLLPGLFAYQFIVKIRENEN
ncbi:MAG: hypothetical protein COY11_05395 [Candidatus Portnoybacteria bacterium CG_4_10_14_0_2_um_filter_44_20]|uniref:Methyltransferase domain-containing protein n=1 Tax=Candidatus Portnoybacteria bacterium CG_4_10_14_0_2_um_filter_44_20 TaxID=1974799 RepID=A0A2M7UCB9_9BACT|nr:MAG: hypothetical protein COY11_05395 [Candidatus Portnoybacteria bacterium CG_4_10_14_0_2_um_filter_44_20]